MITRTGWNREEWLTTSSRRIGIVGTGNMGRIHARILADMGVLVGVADMDLSTAEQVAKTYKVESFKDFHSMIEETKPDGVVIATPTSTHADIAMAIAKNYDGIRGLLIEKPLAGNLEDGKKVAKIVNEKNIITLISHSEIYNPIVGRALSLIETDAIGKPLTVIHDRRGFVSPERISSLGDVFEDIGVHDFDIMARISEGPATLYAQSNTSGGIHNWDCHG
ncbi:MAG: Gfo/Idh/MocA family protein [Candidatus Thorarchaeota archaeon]|jgi:predicted dehydrogenase